MSKITIKKERHWFKRKEHKRLVAFCIMGCFEKKQGKKDKALVVPHKCPKCGLILQIRYE